MATSKRYGSFMNGPCNLGGTFSGGTCLSGPSFDVGLSIPLASGTTSVPLRPFGGTCLSGPSFDVGLSIPLHRARQACPSERFPRRNTPRHVRLSRRDPLVGSACQRSTPHWASAGATSVPLRPFGGTCLSGPAFDVGLSIPLASGTTSVPLRSLAPTTPCARGMVWVTHCARGMVSAFVTGDRAASHNP